MKQAMVAILAFALVACPVARCRATSTRDKKSKSPQHDPTDTHLPPEVLSEKTLYVFVPNINARDAMLSFYDIRDALNPAGRTIMRGESFRTADDAPKGAAVVSVSCPNGVSYDWKPKSDNLGNTQEVTGGPKYCELTVILSSNSGWHSGKLLVDWRGDYGHEAAIALVKKFATALVSQSAVQKTDMPKPPQGE
ncbi:MAG: hypothetical protein ACRD4V_07180 [Candidatus Acidiferrales bacterium]